MPRVLALTDEQRASRRCAAFGDWVDGEIKRRKRAGEKMSREVVAEWLGISPQALSKKVLGVTEWRLYEVMIICKKFKADANQMWDLMNLEDAI